MGLRKVQVKSGGALDESVVVEMKVDDPETSFKDSHYDFPMAQVQGVWGSEELRLTPDFLASVTGAIYFDEKVLGRSKFVGADQELGLCHL